MPSRAEIAFHEVVRGLEGQAQDLAAIRGHVNLALSAGALSAAFIGGVTDDHGIFFWVAVAAFAFLALATIWVYRPVEFQYSFDGYRLVQTYVDADQPPTEDFICESSPCMALTITARTRRCSTNCGPCSQPPSPALGWRSSRSF